MSPKRERKKDIINGMDDWREEGRFTVGIRGL